MEPPMSPHFRSLSYAAAAVAFLAAFPAFADMMTFKTMLDAKSESPANASAGMGELDATYDTATKTLTWKGTYSGLTGPATAAHFHGPAAPGANAGVMVPADAKASPFQGSAVLTDDQAKALLAGMIYFNVHTDANKGGEIRGWLTPPK
jgi:CHRD domain